MGKKIFTVLWAVVFLLSLAFFTTDGIVRAAGVNAVNSVTVRLNYNDSSSRTTTEMEDPDSRPAISGSVSDMGQYDVVFIGYPIWLAYHKLIQCTL